ncbi:hypothetical protein [Actinokineospora terrae]|uniref:Uncharacterized protein n=1 Tax=Actinokineospora terrae TaxID=155974 RepID=A0A1H9L4T5_9PSEU|nr:hypothetical protein [Actinokineospora terrae]SER06380.1 hypothetical protein SAMN04487818_101452 [Actinokineospora terrae]
MIDPGNVDPTPRAANDIDSQHGGSAVQAADIGGDAVAPHQSARGIAGPAVLVGRDLHVRSFAAGPLWGVVVLVVVSLVIAAIVGRPWGSVLLLGTAEISLAVVLAGGPRRPRAALRVILLALVPALLSGAIAVPASRGAALAILFDVHPEPSGVEIQQIATSRNEAMDRVAITVRNNRRDVVPLLELTVYSEFDAGHWVNNLEEWAFQVSDDLVAGPVGADGNRRLHGQVTLADSRFDLPLTGGALLHGDRSWERRFTFTPQIALPAAEAVVLTVDIPVELRVREVGGSRAETRPFSTAPPGSLQTHVELHTTAGDAHACSNLRTPPDRQVCPDTIPPVPEPPG